MEDEEREGGEKEGNEERREGRSKAYLRYRA